MARSGKIYGITIEIHQIAFQHTAGGKSFDPGHADYSRTGIEDDPVRNAESGSRDQPDQKCNPAGIRILIVPQSDRRSAYHQHCSRPSFSGW